MIGYAPRGVNPICSNRALGIIARARTALQVAITRLGARFKVRNWSIANPWTTDV